MTSFFTIIFSCCCLTAIKLTSTRLHSLFDRYINTKRISISIWILFFLVCEYIKHERVNVICWLVLMLKNSATYCDNNFMIQRDCFDFFIFTSKHNNTIDRRLIGKKNMMFFIWDFKSKKEKWVVENW